MSKQRSSGPHRRILVRLCALALIAAMLLTSAYAGGAVDPMAEAAPAAEPRVSASYSVKLSQNVPDHTVQLGIYDADDTVVSTGWNERDTVTFPQWNVEQPTTYTIRVINLGDYVISPMQQNLTVTPIWGGRLSYTPRNFTFTATNIERPDTIQTADTLSKGVNIQLLDYTQSDAESYNNKFTFNGYGEGGNWNQWYAGQGVYQGILYPTIQSDGFPKLGDGDNQTVNAGGSSLSYLFDPKSEVIETAYSGLNYLFQYHKDTGYYTYDSAENFAAVVSDPEDPGQYRFNVYNVPYQRQSTKPGDPKFLPFNDLISTDGNTLDGERNYHFGMTVDFQFLQPKDGLVNGQHMTFDFTGDDDVWLFIDGVLVLDMGGVHDAQNGSIDFATGQIHINGRMQGTPGDNNSHAYSDTLCNIMTKYKDSEWLENNFNVDGSFKDYTTHTFQYYYMERGAGGSNCKIKFNLQSIPDDTIYVQKMIDNSPFEDFADAQFKFKVEVSELNQEGNALLGETHLTPYKGYYQVWNGVVGQSGATKAGDPQYTSDGTFILQHYQYAQLLPEHKTENAVTPIKANSDFRVAEIEAYSNHYEVHIDETTAEWQSEDGQKGSYSSDVLSRVDAASVFFHNVVTEDTETNMFTLKIEKKLTNGASEDEYPVKIEIGGKVYANAPYYRYDNQGTLIPQEYKTNVNGIATIPAGGAIGLQQIPWTTSFEITEVLPDDIRDKYEAPVYAVTNASNICTGGSASGRIPETETEGNITTVTITNSLKSADFTFTKVDASTGDPLAGAKFELWPAGDDWVKDSNVDKPLYPTYQDNGESTGQDGNATFTDIPFGNYLLYEVKAPAGYKLPTDPVRVTVEAGMVTFMKVNGETLDEIELPSGDAEDATGEAATIPNKEQDELPVAGGMGAIWFSASGLALASAAALLYFKQRKKGEE